MQQGSDHDLAVRLHLAAVGRDAVAFNRFLYPRRSAFAGYEEVRAWKRRLHESLSTRYVETSFVVVLTVGITPQILAVGRSIDFVPRDPPPPAVATFGVLHAAYTLLELAKCAAAAVAAGWLVRLGPTEAA